MRTTRRIELTETGQLLLKQTAAAVGSLENSLESILDQNQEPSGIVRITLSRFAYLLILKPQWRNSVSNTRVYSWKFRFTPVP